MTARRIQLRRTKGWHKPACTVVVSRPTRWGNPYVIGQRGVPTARDAIECYRLALKVGLLKVTIGDVRRELRGKNLACWCRLGKPCHADVLLEFANR